MVVCWKSFKGSLKISEEVTVTGIEGGLADRLNRGMNSYEGQEFRVLKARRQVLWKEGTNAP